MSDRLPAMDSMCAYCEARLTTMNGVAHFDNVHPGEERRLKRWPDGSLVLLPSMSDLVPPQEMPDDGH